MAGRTAQYAIEPRAEYVFGIVAEQPMRARRAGRQYVVSPGQLVAWDPTAPHTGSALNGQAWSSRLMIVETGDLSALASDQDSDPLAGITFPEPVLSDPDLIQGFLRLHAALEPARELATTRLGQDVQLVEWLRTVIERAGAPKRTAPLGLTPRDGRGLRRASEYLADRLAQNVSLDELAAAAGIGKFRLVRLFREHTGLPPHALQIAHRVRAARRRLEGGESIADVAANTGFADQSHLHRHFQRSLGVTPGEYQRRIADR
jgi:AraC-like DNA-binding protein